jgi:nucleotide-binding universal stress UspA family protein
MQKFQKILFATDFSMFANNAFPFAVQLSQMFNSELFILHVIVPNTYPSFYDIHNLNFMKMIKRIKSESPNVLRKLLYETPGPKVEADTYVIVGQPAYQILKFINDDEADLMIISSHGLSDIDYFLLGNTAEKVIKRATCPVLSLKLTKTN